MNKRKINIVYYSGTGGTTRVAHSFEKAFKEAGCEVMVQRLFHNVTYQPQKDALLLLVYAVHACNAPEPVYKWLDSLDMADQAPAIVISVSGGGEVIPNTACRVSTIKKLRKKGYVNTYEKMLIMPSNWVVAIKEPLAQMLLEVLPSKVNAIVEDIENGTIKRTKPLWIDRLFSLMGELEKLGARSFGKRIKVSNKCTQCGWCVDHCPAGNISLNSNKIEFGNRCHLCLCCIYGCPHKALEPGFGKFVVLQEGYNLKVLESMRPLEESIDVDELAKGYIWSGVRKYLVN